MGRLSRREVLRLALIGGGALVGGTIAGGVLLRGRENSPTPEIREKRQLARKAVIIGGGYDENSNYPSFFADLYLWYYMARDILAVPESDITVLYHDGKPPQNARDWLSQKLLEDPLTQLKETLDRFPVEAVPISGDTRKESVLETITQASRSSGLDQLLIFRSGHGFMRWLGNSDGSRETRSTMLLSNDEMLDNVELANALVGNRVGEVMTFLNQCYATFNLDMVNDVPNLSVFTASGGNGADAAYTDLRVDFQWPWTEAMQGAIFRPTESDTESDGKVCLADLQQAILRTDYMATKGFYTEAYGQIYTHPGFAHGAMIDPHQTALLQYK